MGAQNNQRIPPFNPQGSPVGFAPASQVELGKILGNAQPAKGCRPGGDIRPGAAGLLDERVRFNRGGAKGAKGGARPGAAGLLDARVPIKPMAQVPGPVTQKPTQRFDRGSLL